MIRFSCPACMKPLKAPLNATGQRVACPRCGGRMFVPPSVEGKTAPPPSNPSPPPPPRPGAWGRGGKLLTFLAAALVVLGFAAAGAWLGSEDPSPPKEGVGSQASWHRPPSALDLPWTTREDPKEETRVVPT